MKLWLIVNPTTHAVLEVCPQSRRDGKPYMSDGSTLRDGLKAYLIDVERAVKASVEVNDLVPRSGIPGGRSSR